MRLGAVCVSICMRPRVVSFLRGSLPGWLSRFSRVGIDA